MPRLHILSDPSTAAHYPPVDHNKIVRLEIFPPIGIARVGDSEIECFLAPEVPGRTYPPNGLRMRPNGQEFKFRDAHQRLRRQAVRFRVYAYDAHDKLLGEVNSENGYILNWTVQVANKKAANYVHQRGGHFDPHETALRNPKIQPDLNLEDRSLLIVADEGAIASTDPLNTFVLLNKGTFQGSRVELAQLQRDTRGRLVFVPGKGEARSIVNPSKPQPPIISAMDSSNWIDEICDGQVKVVVTRAGTDHKVGELGRPATVLSAPPNFAWGINAPTTLYDTIENIYREEEHPLVPRPTVHSLDFWKHIWPILLSASSLSWTNNQAFQGHGVSSNGHYNFWQVLELFVGDAGDDVELMNKRKYFKSRIFEKLRKPLNRHNPDQLQADTRYMPRLSGDAGELPEPGTFTSNLQPDARKFAALTKLQHDRFRIWTNDDTFHLPADGVLPIPRERLEDVDLKDQTEELTRAILETAIGDPLYPGIEMYWIAKLNTTYDTNHAVKINPPFRINTNTILPGHLTRGLSLPWQCDFDLCKTHWWPSVRPDDIVPKVVFHATVQGSNNKTDFDTAITARTKWTRGLRDTVIVTPTQEDWPGSDDMVRYWKYLGVVRKTRNAFTDRHGWQHSVFLEDERVWM
ncbi:uncharacterized protein LACBIDRAFT_304964 [Laccaria bicolor S238N-H82]|uniref:Predicted protein n=1 Tax=Laccaria bicolor (strain S238N-H82 / ATCC MYA-4686) TaxID=486041 RepID=B0CT20_LACBS|nr:uncharacterized protein LACBIDRAFT_304964 [Laccaria bicolor S238N-H82]EDR13863.1 predicted protein [Laccaria bicolor S238N-H82]|eukprot:XP_001874422.1 predicted protein [Laccaria bicolor S238N-H82]